MCISFGNPSEPCCGEKLLKPGWTLAVPFLYGMNDLQRNFSVWRSGYTSRREFRARDWHFRLQPMPPRSGKARYRFSAFQPPLPERTVVGTGAQSDVNARWWKDIVLHAPYVLEATTEPWVNPYKFEAVPAAFPGFEFQQIEDPYAYRNFKVRAEFPGGSAQLHSSGIYLQLDPVTRAESLARRFDGQQLAVLCRGRLTGEDFNGFQFSWLFGDDFYMLIPLAVEYQRTTKEWTLTAISNVQSGIRSQSWFRQSSLVQTGPMSARVTWSAGEFGRDVTGNVYFERI